MSRTPQHSKRAAGRKKRATIIITEDKDGSLSVKAQFSPNLEESGDCGILALKILTNIKSISSI